MQDLTLSDYLKGVSLNPSEFLKLALELCDLLDHLHKQNLFPNELTADNILVTLRDGKLHITGLRSSGAGRRGDPLLLYPEYVSPEQSGRIDQPLDRRSDIYSLGVVFYQMLTGELPFHAGDISEWTHAHIALLPLSPQQINPMINGTLAEIILKMLAKNVTDRYQTCYGLRADLILCWRQWQQKGIIDPFPLGQDDIRGIMRPPGKLYGREEECQTLKDAWMRVSDGRRSELLLVSGSAGTGKTVLGLSLKPLVQSHGYFIYGKFDQVKKDIPYSALAGAFSDLVRQFLAEGKNGSDRWSVVLNNALGSDGSAIMTLIPELKYLVGEPGDYSQRYPTLTRSRFELSFKNFIAAVATLEHPLVLFLDDLQWADDASLQLMERFSTLPESVCLLMVGAYRDDEIESGHMLFKSLEHITETGLAVKRIKLEPLSRAIFNQLVADILYISEEDSRSLSEVLFPRTDGNPLFLLQLMQMLNMDKQLVFDEATAGWTWDLNAIKKYPGSENIIVLMTEKLGKLSAATRNTLSLAACIGSKFDIELLSALELKEINDTRKDLHEGIAAGLIIEERENSEPEQYAFIHDRVQQAAYDLLDKREKQERHYQIGKFLIASQSLNQDNYIFRITDHLNLGNEEITSEGERLMLAGYNLRAGIKARASGAWIASLKYLRTGTALLPPDGWTKEYRLSFELYRERALGEYLEINFDQAAQYFDLILEQAQTSLERADVNMLKVTLYGNQGKREAAVRTGIEALAELGVKLPLKPHPVAIRLELLRLKKQIGAGDVSKFPNLPPLDDPAMIKALELIMAMIPWASISHLRLFALLIMRMTRISLKYGNSRFSAIAFCSYGIIGSLYLKDYRLACRMQKLALDLSKQYPDDELSCSLNFAVAEFLSHWHEPAAKGLEYLQQANYYALRSGNRDLITGGTALERMIQRQFILGRRLDEINAEILGYIEFVRWSKFKSIQMLLTAGQQFIFDLQGQCNSNLGNKDHDKVYIANFIKEKCSLTVQLEYNLLKIRSLYLQHHYKKAFALVKEFLHKKEIIKGLIVHAEMIFYESLVISAVIPGLSRKESKQYLRILNKNLRQMKTWAVYAPENFASRAQLMQAELYRIKGHYREALNYYNQAIVSACESKCCPIEAIASERAARLLWEQNLLEKARLYLHRAHRLFLNWGAGTCAQLLEGEFPLDLAPENAGLLIREPYSILSRPDNPEQTTTQVDLFTVIKAAQAIAGEVDLEKLLAQVMQFLMENAGAQKACLLMQEDGQLLVMAQSDENGMSFLHNTPLDEAAGLSRNIVEYVRKTCQCLVLRDAAREGIFISDSYIKLNRVKSVACLPIFKQGKLMGILYLENNLAPQVFSPDRVDILSLVSAQIAVSLENARLFTQIKESRDQTIRWNEILEHRVKERTRDWEQANDELRLSEERYKNIFENTGTAMLLIEENGVITLVNSKVEEIFGYHVYEIKGQKWNQLQAILGVQDIEKQFLRWKKDRKQNTSTLEIQVQDARGKVRDVFVTASLVPGNNSIIASLLDITKRKQMEKAMQHMAYHDSLTGLSNRLSFYDRLEQAIMHARRSGEILGIMFIDLDNFKEINDNFGHQNGDRVLCEVAVRLKNAIRESDTVARYGGDEFTLIFNGLKKEQDLELITGKIRAGLHKPLVSGDTIIPIQASMGISLYPVSSTDANELIEIADQAMYRDKAGKLNQAGY